LGDKWDFGQVPTGLLQANFCHDFLKRFWKIEKLIIFMGFFFQLVPQNKSYAQISSKQGATGQQKENSKFEFELFLTLFSHRLYQFCLHRKL